MTTALSGLFWRSVFATDLERVLNGVKSPEGRYHHDGQAALYMSPTPQYSRIALNAYLRDDDAPRLVVPLAVQNANVADLRHPDTQRSLRLNGTEASVPWLPERAIGRPATSWIASDAARSAGYDGIIYAARSDATRWHIVLFRWNQVIGPVVRQSGLPISF